MMDQRRSLYAVRNAAEELIGRNHEAPLAFGRLWRPHCTRWNLDRDQPRGCGRELSPVPGQRGVYQCTTPGCALQGQPQARTSQRDTVRELLTTRRLVAYMIGGANRAGKSEAAIQLAVALAAGSGEWWVRHWCEINDIPADAIPAEPARADKAVIVSALTFNDSLEYHRPKLDRWLPLATVKRKWKAQDQAEAILPNGGRIVLKLSLIHI